MNFSDTLLLILVAAIPLIPFILLVSSSLVNWQNTQVSGKYIATLFGVLWLSALVALILVLVNGKASFSLLSLNINSIDVPIFGFLADRLSLVIALLVITVSGVVHLFSLRALQEEKHFKRYYILLSLVTVDVLLVVLSDSLLMMCFFWILKGLTMTFLLTHYHHREASIRAAFNKLRADIVGAVAFIGALVLVWQSFGTFDIEVINATASQTAQTLPTFQLTLLTLLLLVAAMAKSAQFPFHSWLPYSVEAPTPVSALMHAGLINAGGFLLIRLSPLFVATPVTLVFAVFVGGFTVIYGTMIMLTRNDVKGMLVYSTLGQMGFMILECGLGAFGLAALHLVAHGLFKATLFLGSGSVIQQKTESQHLAPAEHQTNQLPIVRFAISSVIVTLVLFVVPSLLGFSMNTGTILVAFAWFTVMYTVPKVASVPSLQFYAGITGFTLLYVLGTHAVELFFKPVIAPAPTLEPALVFVICGVLVMVGLASIIMQSANKPAWLNRLNKSLYMRALFTGYGK